MSGDVRARNCGVGTQVVSVALLRTLIDSRLPKKNALSRLIGPPMEIRRTWLRLNGLFSIPRALLSNVFVASFSLRKNS